eukprot:1159475-Pelagomonas_calceolata.AAC.1
MTALLLQHQPCCRLTGALARSYFHPHQHQIPGICGDNDHPPMCPKEARSPSHSMRKLISNGKFNQSKAMLLPVYSKFLSSKQASPEEYLKRGHDRALHSSGGLQSNVLTEAFTP